jgi:hypothetical protein
MEYQLHWAHRERPLFNGVELIKLLQQHSGIHNHVNLDVYIYIYICMLLCIINMCPCRQGVQRLETGTMASGLVGEDGGMADGTGNPHV